MNKLFYAIAATAMLAAPAANAQDLLAGKPIYTLGPAKTWTAGTESYTFKTEDLSKLVATPTNTENVFLYPENSTLNTDENREKGIQGFYVDMEESQEVALVKTTWEGAAAKSYKIWLTDAEPTLDILDTDATYSATGLGDYKANTAVLPEGTEGRYLVFQPIEASNWGWGVKIRSISALAPAEAVLTTFSVSPSFMGGIESEMSFSFKDQNDMDIDPSKVTVTVTSDNATLNEDNILERIGMGNITLAATMGNVTLTATVYVPTAPGNVADDAFKTPIYINNDEWSGMNEFVNWETGYNGGAENLGEIYFTNSNVAWGFGNTRCVFFSNANIGAWDKDINPTAEGFKSLNLSIFGTKDVTGNVEFERTTAIGNIHPFTLKAGEWTNIEVILTGETNLHTMSVRFDEANACDILLANIYFTPAFVEGDETAPVLEAPVAEPAATSVKLTLKATDDLAEDITYEITVDGESYKVAGKSGEEIVYTVANLNPNTEYTFSVTASDGKNVSEAQEVKATTTAFPAAPAPTIAKEDVLAIYSNGYEATPEDLAFDAWGSKGAMNYLTDTEDQKVLNFTGYNGQWGGLVNFLILADQMNKLHIDIYGTAEDGTLEIAPVWRDVQGGTPSKKIDVKANQWTGYDIDLSDFDKPETDAYVFQFSMSQSTVAGFAIDNLYLYSTQSGISSVGADNSEAAYYTLQGVRVANADKGVYIVVKNGKATKVIK